MTEELPAPDTVIVPDINVALSAKDLKDTNKYFFFHRSDTDFKAAYHDISECDTMARGLLPGTGNSPYGGLTVALGLAAIVSANQRNVRRKNLRRCMFFKGYSRYALPKDVWKQIAFDESGSGISGDARKPYLLKQARIASGPRPEGQELGE